RTPQQWNIAWPPDHRNSGKTAYRRSIRRRPRSCNDKAVPAAAPGHFGGSVGVVEVVAAFGEVPFDDMADLLDDGDTRVPFVVARDDVPAGALLVGLLEHVFNGCFVVGAAIAVSPVFVGEFPRPQWVLGPVPE